MEFLLIFFFFFFSADSALIQPDNTFSTGKHFYRTLTVDSKSSALYVGAKSRLFKLWLYNINDTSSPSLYSQRNLEPKNGEREECLQNGHSEEECENWVRMVFVKSDGQLVLCSSNAMKPQLYSMDSTLSDIEYPKTIIGICSAHSNVNTTAVFVEKGNADDIPAIYSGIRTGLSLENHLIYRPPLVFNNKEIYPALKTVFTDSKWLNEPQFVGSFDVGNFVYFFFREVAVEAESCGRTVYSRVARLCKRDIGGKTVLRNVWSSFVKARLNCSVGASVPFHFNFIQSVSAVRIDAETLFYGTFTSSESSFASTAICSFEVSQINRLFDNGVFLEQTNGIWTPTSPDRLPTHRPGSCALDSQSLPDDQLHFAKSHLLMAESVPSGEPLLTFRDQILTTIRTDLNGRDVVLFALEPQSNTLHKILHWREERQIRRIGSYRLPSNDRIWDISLLPGEYFFVAEDSKISQFRVGQCSSHSHCRVCSADPYCSWNIARAECFPRDSIHSTAVNWISGVQNEHRCISYLKSESKTIYPGDSIHLKCLQTQNSQWIFEQNLIAEESEHFIRTENGGLILLNASSEHSGTYQCIADGKPIIEYTVAVDHKDCSQPKTIQQFHSAQREWCKKYDHYKSNLSKWQQMAEENNECPREAADQKSADSQKLQFL